MAWRSHIEHDQRRFPEVAWREESMDEIVRSIVSFIVPIIEACGMVVVTLGVVRAFIQYLVAYVGKSETKSPVLRLRLGQSMVLGLEFMVAADILKTALSPTWNDVLFLAALVGLRTVLNYLLEADLKTITIEAGKQNS
jgi:uncharacterized membrane protein